MEIELLPLKCPECGSDIISTEMDNLHFCTGCGNAFTIKRGEWKKIKTIYAKPALPSPDGKYIYLPFWALRTKLTFREKPKPGAVIISDENTISPFLEKKISVFLKEPDAKVNVDFFIPAFGTTNRYLLMDNIGMEFTKHPPEIHIGKPKEMLGGKYTIEDALIIAKSLLLSMEKEPVFLLKYKFDLTLIKYFVIGIPFYREESFFVDALKGKRMFQDGVENIDEILKKIGGGNG